MKKRGWQREENREVGVRERESERGYDRGGGGGERKEEEWGRRRSASAESGKSEALCTVGARMFSK